jgi:hypothetical protein
METEETFGITASNLLRSATLTSAGDLKVIAMQLFTPLGMVLMMMQLGGWCWRAWFSSL